MWNGLSKKCPNFKNRRIKTLASLFSLFCLTTTTVGCLPEEIALPIGSIASPTPGSNAATYEGFTGATTAQTTGPTKVLVSWNRSTDSRVTVYNVYDVTLISQPKLIKTVAASASSASITGLNNQYYYSFRVRAADEQNREDGNINDVAAITYGGVISSEVLSSTSARLTFNDGSDSDQINIYCKTVEEPSYKLMKQLTNVSLTQTTLTGLTIGVQYTCRVALVMGGLVDNNTNTVTFTPMGQATQLIFTTQPGSSAAGSVLEPQPVVTIMDVNNNVVSAGPDASAVITLTVSASSPSLGTVRGTASVAAVKGVATFSSLNFQEAGIKILTATKADTSGQANGSGALTADSAEFTISPAAVSATKSTIAVSPLSTLVANGIAAFTVTITLADQYGNLIAGVKPTIASSIPAETISQPTAATGTNGTTTGSITSTVAGTRTLSIGSPSGLSSVTTTATFVAGAATKVAFVQQPTNTPAGPGAINNLQVGVQDAQGNIVTTGASASATIAVSIFTNPGGGTLSGTASMQAVNGVATFNGLGIDKTGTGYKLVANSAPLAVAYSNSFNVTAGVPSKIGITGPSSVLSGVCSTAVLIQLQDFAGNPANATANTSIALSGLGSAGLYTSSACTGSPVGNTITFASGSNLKTLYLKDVKAEGIVVMASDPATVLSAGTKAIDINPSQVGLSGPASVTAGKCSSAFTITTYGSDGSSGVVSTNTEVQINGLAGSLGNFYSTNDCSGAPLDPLHVVATADTSTTNIYFKDGKSEVLTIAVLDPASIMSTATSAQVLTVTPSNIRFTGPTTVVSGLCSTAFTIELRDALGNPVAAAADTLLNIEGLAGTTGKFYTSGACGGSAIGSALLIPQNSSSIQVYFSDNAAETLTLSISDPAANLAVSETIVLQVSPSALGITGPTPASAKTSVCAGPFTLNTMDGGGNITAAITPVTANLTGAGPGGTFYTDSACTSTVTQFVFENGQSAKQFYFLGLAPAVATPLTFTATDAAGVLAAGTLNFTVTPAPAWIGSSAVTDANGIAQTSWFETGKVPVAARQDGPMSTYYLHFDSSKRYLFVTDYSAHRVLKYDYLNQVYLGWIGRYDATGFLPIRGSTIPALNISCALLASTLQTPGWCLGGQSGANGNGSTGNMYSPYGITDDGTSIYVTQRNGHSVSKYNMETGAFEGFIGRVSASPTGPTDTCRAVAPNQVVPEWCTGGTIAGVANVGDGTIYYPRGIMYSDPYLYIGSNGAVLRYHAATGKFMGWIGWISSAPTGHPEDISNSTCETVGTNRPTPHWCKGGSFTAVHPNTGGIYQPGAFLADVANDILYVSDPDYNHITKFRLSTGVYLGIFGNGTIGNTLSPNQIVADGGYFYTADVNRIAKIDVATGQVHGWVGKVASKPVSGEPGCSDLVPNANTPGWCLGGSAKPGMDENAVNALYAIAMDADGNLITGQGPNSPVIKKWNKATGAYMGTMSLVSDSPAKWSANPTTLSQYQGWGDDTFNQPMGMYVYNGYMYAADLYTARVKKINLATGATEGWIGGITSSPTGGAAGCAGASAMAFSPGWCLGALFNPHYVFGGIIPGSVDGIFYTPTGITGDGTYLYVTDYSYHRISKYEIATGHFVGWVGGLSTEPISGCTGHAGQSSGTGWCKGGSPAVGSNDGYLRNPAGIYHSNGELYVVDYNNFRVVKFNAATGAFGGWIGRINAAPTSGCTPAVLRGYNYSGSGWCMGGTATASIAGGDPGGGFNWWQYPNITGDGTHLYIINSWNSRVDKFTMNGVFAGALKTRYDVLATTWTPPLDPAGANPWPWIWEGFLGQGLWTDGIHLYGSADGYLLWKKNLSTGNLVGWKGAIGGSPTAGEEGCVGATGVTPGWCQYGSPTYGMTLGKFWDIDFITGDDHYIYVADRITNRITRLPK